MYRVCENVTAASILGRPSDDQHEIISSPNSTYTFQLISTHHTTPTIKGLLKSLPKRTLHKIKSQLLVPNRPGMLVVGSFFVNTASAAMSTLGINNEPVRASGYGPCTSVPPSSSDVLEVKNILLKSHALPLDIIDAIIDHAEYWPHTTIKTKDPGVAMVSLRRRSGTGDNHFVVSLMQPSYFPIPYYSRLKST
jgi:hypothetical protein